MPAAQVHALGDEDDDLDIVHEYEYGDKAYLGKFIADIGEDIEEIDLSPAILAAMTEMLQKRLNRTDAPKCYMGVRST